MFKYHKIYICRVNGVIYRTRLSELLLVICNKRITRESTRQLYPLPHHKIGLLLIIKYKSFVLCDYILTKHFMTQIWLGDEFWTLFLWGEYLTKFHQNPSRCGLICWWHKLPYNDWQNSCTKDIPILSPFLLHAGDYLHM